MTRPKELPVIDRTFEMLKWYTDHVGRFPRCHRYGFGLRLEHKLHDVLDDLVLAQYGRGEERLAALHRANARLQAVRLLSRMAVELRLLPAKSYEFAATNLTEIGKMVGGWIRHLSQNARVLTA